MLSRTTDYLVGIFYCSGILLSDPPESGVQLTSTA